MQFRTLGSTGLKVSLIGLGGWHIGLKNVSEPEGLKIMHAAIDAGINFFDNSWDYNEGLSEERMGRALKNGKRDKVILMTKLDGRSKKAATEQLDQSLKRLDVDCIDVVQHHEVIRYEDADRIFHEDGANAALLEAKKAGKIKHIGFTGHKDPHIHLHTLDIAKKAGFTFETVQMPLNVMDAHYRSFEQLVLPRLVEEKIGVLGMKSLANGVVLKSNTATPIECLHYAMNLPLSVLVVGMDSMKIFDQAIHAVDTFKPRSVDEVAALLEKTRASANTGKFEPFKTSSVFDSTTTNPRWLGEEPESVKQMVPNLG